MDLSIISKKFTLETLKEIASNAGIGTENVVAEFADSNMKKGDSYLSEIYRLIVTSKTGKVKVLVKTMPKTVARRQTFRSDEFFKNEIDFYTKIIPALMDFQKSTGSKDIFDEYPQCLAAYSDGENDFLVLEDISVSGYIAPCRQSYTETETCSLILKVLGRFHAVSLAFKDQKPEEFQKVISILDEHYYAKNLKNWYGGFLKLASHVALDAVQKTYPNSEYSAKAEKFLGENLFEDMISMVNNKTAYAVIGHGDCWRPNFLTKYDSTGNKPEKVKIIDFQLVRYGSSIFDLIFLLYNSTSQEQRIKHYEQLLKDYHTSACNLIQNLGSDAKKIFPYEGFKEELKKFGRFGCGFCIESLPLSMLDDDDVTDLDTVNFENSTLLDFWKIKPLENVENRKRLADIFKHAVDNGYL
ncbi:uncharacterized protein LOC129613499 [Condylostylus longicornis]|uniref:uncharacterized protein LOC129613499 n=1 Tax=Condylostylus longicornis TaxID=2530218 RepID=UPI00244E3C0E|nr:uncharacterized protein LOC129613499 [Condylostylus longicornis]XP_055383578.1 uncharacterized protein LOC129613499 [Condylostylus longicornis]